MHHSQLLLALFLAACFGGLAVWALCYWCTRSSSAAALKVRQVLNLGGPDGPGDGPP